MIISCMGHAKFVIELDNGLRIVTDPYDASCGYPVTANPADVVLVSHQHHDHNAVETIPGHPRVIDRAGDFDLGGGAAVRAMAPFADVQAHMTALRAQLLDALGALEIPVNSPADGLPCIVNFSVPGIRSETMLHFLAARGVYVSSGSACARGHKSHVLAAMGLPADRIDSAIRVSFGMQNTADDIDQLIDALRDGLNTLTRRR